MRLELLFRLTASKTRDYDHAILREEHVKISSLLCIQICIETHEQWLSLCICTAILLTGVMETLLRKAKPIWVPSKKSTSIASVASATSSPSHTSISVITAVVPVQIQSTGGSAPCLAPLHHPLYLLATATVSNLCRNFMN